MRKLACLLVAALAVSAYAAPVGAAASAETFAGTNAELAESGVSLDVNPDIVAEATTVAESDAVLFVGDVNPGDVEGGSIGGGDIRVIPEPASLMLLSLAGLLLRRR